MATFFVKSFGCKLNQYEGDVIFESFLRAGFRPAPLREAEVVVVNGCTVTARADQKLRQFVRRVRRQNQRARIILTGCTAQAILKGLLAAPEGVEIVGREWRYNIPAYLTSAPPQRADDFPSIEGFGVRRARCWLKIQDGCSRRCSYCIVPIVRGPSRSRNPDEIVENARELVRKGFSEIVVTGVDIGDWRWGKMRLHHLLQRLLDETDVQRLRLSSLEPPGLTDELAKLIATQRRIAPHLHVPLQSGSERLLREMGRPRYSIGEVLERLEDIRAEREDLCVGTDIIVGFPTETEADFGETVSLLRSGSIAYAHLFRFSPRPATKASELAPLPAAVVKERMRLLAEIDRENRRAFAERFVGKVVEVLVERTEGAKAFGHCPNYLRVEAVGEAFRGETILVEVDVASNLALTGRIVGRKP